MPTSKRKWYPGATYHITARGNHRNDIFKDEEDFEYYLTAINEACEYYVYYQYEIICYCLMDSCKHCTNDMFNAVFSFIKLYYILVYQKYFVGYNITK